MSKSKRSAVNEMLLSLAIFIVLAEITTFLALTGVSGDWIVIVGVITFCSLLGIMTAGEKLSEVDGRGRRTGQEVFEVLAMCVAAAAFLALVTGFAYAVAVTDEDQSGTVMGVAVITFLAALSTVSIVQKLPKKTRQAVLIQNRPYEQRNEMRVHIAERNVWIGLGTYLLLTITTALLVLMEVGGDWGFMSLVLTACALLLLLRFMGVRDAAQCKKRMSGRDICEVSLTLIGAAALLALVTAGLYELFVTNKGSTGAVAIASSITLIAALFGFAALQILEGARSRSDKAKRSTTKGSL